jgi:hypothetical protein
MQLRGASAVETSTLRNAQLALQADGSLIHDDTLRERVDTVVEVLFVASFANEAMQREGLSGGVVALKAQTVMKAVRGLLECYLTERTPRVDPWSPTTGGERLPERAEAGAWIRRTH